MRPRSSPPQAFPAALPPSASSQPFAPSPPTAKLTLNQLDAIAVVHGPGSFTGVRVGLSAAKGLCHALNLPLVAISRLAVLASLCPKPNGCVHALLDAGRGEFYSGIYADGLCLREALVSREQFFAEHIRKPQPSLIVCEPVVAQSLATLTPQLVTEPTAVDALPLALARIQQRAFDDPATIDANYLRRSDAEIFAKPIAPAAPQLRTARSGSPAQ